MSLLHPTAIVEEGARLAKDVEIGPYCVISAGTVLGEGAKLRSHVVTEGRVRIGARTTVWPFAFLGGPPQDVSYQGEDTEVVIGSDCLVREHVTVHRGTAPGRRKTVIGDHCFVMSSAHIGHDCLIGDHVIISSHVGLGGHCVVGDRVIFGGLAAVQQRVVIGAHAFIGGATAITSNVVPYGLAVARGTRAELAGPNVVGLRRQGVDRATIAAMKAAYDAFFASGGTRGERIAAVRAAYPGLEQISEIADFLESCGNAPLVQPQNKDRSGKDA